MMTLSSRLLSFMERIGIHLFGPTTQVSGSGSGLGPQVPLVGLSLSALHCSSWLHYSERLVSINTSMLATWTYAFILRSRGGRQKSRDRSLRNRIVALLATLYTRGLRRLWSASPLGWIELVRVALLVWIALR